MTQNYFVYLYTSNHFEPFKTCSPYINIYVLQKRSYDKKLITEYETYFDKEEYKEKINIPNNLAPSSADNPIATDESNMLAAISTDCCTPIPNSDDKVAVIVTISPISLPRAIRLRRNSTPARRSFSGP